MVLIICICISVMVLIIVMLVMNGFDNELCLCIFGVVLYVIIFGVGESIYDWQGMVKLVEVNLYVCGVVFYVDLQVFLQGIYGFIGVMVCGIELVQEFKVLEIDKYMVQGCWDLFMFGSWNIVLGKELVMQFGVNVGDWVIVYVLQLCVILMGVVFKVCGFYVFGIFELGMQ